MNQIKPVLRAYTFAYNWQLLLLNDSAVGRDMTVEIISWSISMKVWDWAAIKPETPGFAIRHASVARHVTDCLCSPVFRNICANSNFCASSNFSASSNFCASRNFCASSIFCAGSIFVLAGIFVFCLVCCFTSHVNNYGQDETVSSPNHTFPGQNWRNG